MISSIRKQTDEKRKLGTRQQLLNASASVFIRNGYHKTLISDIVSEAGVGQGSFYRNFSDKRMIFEALLDNFVEELLEEFADIQVHPAETFEEYRSSSINAIKRMSHKIYKKRDLFTMFLREIPSIDKKFTNKLENILDQFTQVAKFHLDHVIKRGLARPCRTDIVAHSMIGIALRLFEQWGAERLEKISLDDLIDEACNFAFFGVATKT